MRKAMPATSRQPPDWRQSWNSWGVEGRPALPRRAPLAPVARSLRQPLYRLGEIEIFTHLDKFEDISARSARKTLEDLFGRRVELITPESLSPYLRPHIMHEVRYAPVAG